MSFVTPEIIDRARKHYDEGRAYHNWGHVEALYLLFHEYRSLVNDPDVFEVILVLHDVIYDSRRNDNEERSAQLAVEWLADVAEPRQLDAIHKGIVATARHLVPEGVSQALASDIALFCDMDLAILGSDEATFRRYDEAIREEYSWVPEDQWREGRGAVLRKFLAREAIFATAPMRDRFEASARRNLEAALVALSG
ncbi:hypothetical protein OIU34_20060 [Pararhizobium sp. BT-229]|uniref:HD domain-containing protein n=1 Tax=Pararhizobium sp. BT-229 TaxID=2986923 RepID=UPI0021F6C0E5|nr:hypothetical protein [Pararhizobium sp. BT-229]MCV9964182.1 hypothetical protein [Pararhizobium sp. BT-229]